MKRNEVAALLGHTIGSRVVIASLGSAGRAWRESGGDQPTFYASDPMGAAPGLALGAAIARPDRQFVLIEGDGDLLMNVGSLIAIAGASPNNLRMVVFANHRYETGGGQPLANAESLDISAIARASAWEWSETLGLDTSLPEAEKVVRQWCVAAGPALLVARVHPQASPYGGPGELSGSEARFVFQQQFHRWDRERENTHDNTDIA